MILFFIFLISYGQKLMIDSRGSPIESKNLNQFNQKFSIWFTYKLTSNYIDEDLFIIVNNNNYLLRMQPQMMKMFIINNKNQINVVEYKYLINNTDWIHLIISQNKKFQSEFFYIDFEYPFTYHVQIDLNKQVVLQNQSQIITMFNSNFLCLIYDQITYEIPPIIRSTNMQQLIIPSQIKLYQYKFNSLFEVFMKKYVNNIQASKLLSIVYQDNNLFEIKEQSDVLFLLAFEQPYKSGQFQIYKWFNIVITFYQKQIEIEILFVDENFSLKLTNHNLEDIFYEVCLFPQDSNYQYMKFTEYFNVDYVDLINQKDLSDLNNCQIGLDKYYIYENNTCSDFIDLEQIQIIPSPQEQQIDFNQLFNGIFHSQMVAEAIQKQLITYGSDDADIPLVHFITQNKQKFLKDPFIYWKNSSHSVCMPNYFGKNCKQYIKKCLVASNRKCIYCQDGYQLIQSQCKKCPQRCLICFHQSLKQKCLLPDKYNYINKDGQAKICNCRYCNTMGQCLTQEYIIDLIDKCFNKTTCILRKCLKSGYFFSLKSQKCKLLDKDYFNQFTNIAFQRQQQFQLEEIQHIILQTHQIYGDFILNNSKLNKFYFEVQLIQRQNLIQNTTLDLKFQRFLSKLNLACNKRQMDLNQDILCLDYVNKQNNKCSKIPCLFKLEINNINYYLGHQNFIEHNNFTFNSIYEFLKSVKDIGVNFNQVKLDIQFIILNNQARDINCSELLHQLNLSNFNQSKIIINVQFTTFLYSEQHQVSIALQTEELMICNQIIFFNLHLLIITRILKIKNLTIDFYTEFNMVIQSGETIVIDSVQMNGDFNLNLSLVQSCLIRNYNSSNESKTYLQFVDIDNFYIESSKIFNIQSSKIIINDFSYYLLFSIGKQIFTIIDVIFQFSQLIQNTILDLQINQIIIKNVTIIGDLLYDTNLIKIYSKKIILNNLNIQIKNLYNSTIFQIRSKQIEIVNFSFYSTTFQYAQLLLLFTDNLDIYQLNITQSKGHKDFLKLNIQRNIFIYFQVEQNCNIKGLHFEEVQIYDQHFLAIFVGYHLNIIEMHIKNIKIFCYYYNQFISLASFYSADIVFNRIIFQNIQVDRKNRLEFYLIDVQQTFGNVIFEDFQVNQIFSNIYDNKPYIFSIDSKVLKLSTIQVANCVEFQFLKILSKYIFISNLIFKNNHQDKIFIIDNYGPEIMLMENCIFNLFQTTLLYVEFIEIKIRLKEIQINLFAVFKIFLISECDIYVENLSIINQNLYQQNFDNYWFNVFDIENTKLFIRNLIARNLNQKLIHSNQGSIVILENIQLINFYLHQTEEMYVIIILDSSLIIYQLKISQIKNFYGIFNIFGTGLIYFQFIRIQNIYVNRLMNLERAYQNAKSIINDIYIEQFQGKEVFSFNLQEKSQIIINNLFLTQSDNFENYGTLNQLLLYNSIVYQIANFTFQHTKVQLKQSEIIFNQSLKFLQIEMDHSLIHNILTQEKIYKSQFIITLSFFEGSNLESKILQNTEHIYEIQKYFFIPSGQKLTEYKRLNLQTLQYQQVYEGFYIVTQGFFFGQSGYELQCNQFQYYNSILVENDNNLQTFAVSAGINQINDYVFIVNPHNTNITVFKIVCSSDINNQIIQLSYSVKAFPCQLGEYLYQNKCLECNLNQNLFSVTFNATMCHLIDSRIQSAKKGLIKLQQQYWRYKYNSHIIEYCSSENCIGGWIPGDLSCNYSRVGALCMECDLYNIKGDGYFTKSNEQCQLCQESYVKLVFQLLCSIFWQVLIVLSGYYSNYKLSKQYLMFRVGFRQYYQILYRQSIDQPTILLKMFINYIFMLYLIRQSLNLQGFIFVININIINNPGLVLQAQLDCLLSKLIQLEIIYSQYFYQLLLVFFILSFSYLIYFIMLHLKLIKHQLGFILYVTEGLLIYNIKIILDISCQLLSYTIASGQKWVKQNKQYLFYSEQHIGMFYYIIPISVILFISPLIFHFAMKNLSIFNRHAQRVYAVYFQQFKNVFFYWDYIILYTKYTLIIFQIIDNQSNQQNVVIVWLLTIFSLNYKPYYLQNLNQFELNLLAFYGIQLNLLNMGNYKDYFIIVCNIFIFRYFLIKMYNCHNFINVEKKIYWKQKLITLMPIIKQYSGVDRNQRQQINRQLLLNLINTKILKKQKIESIKQRFSTEIEIELSPIIKIQHTQSIFPSRLEPSN